MERVRDFRDLVNEADQVVHNVVRRIAAHLDLVGDPCRYRRVASELPLDRDDDLGQGDALRVRLTTGR